ncbi:hypothetical protein SO802_026843 [Lithocarpus litseifolius]|uniref:Uncharacterized protein n=1 Tax=Lithocarpus litseifolius TaxID=425828 RepID=A0AAW2C2D2_9ROSI
MMHSYPQHVLNVSTLIKLFRWTGHGGLGRTYEYGPTRGPRPIKYDEPKKQQKGHPRSGETLRSYTNRYWELYNEIGSGNEQVAASTFRIGLPEDSKLRDSLKMRLPEGMHQLMRRIEEYKRLEDDRL